MAMSMRTVCGWAPVALIALALVSGESGATGQQGLPPSIPPPLGRGAGPNTPTGTGLILGQIVDATGNRPVAGAVVALTGSGVTRTVLAESRGRFVFRDLPSGAFTITASKPGWVEGAYGRRRPKGAVQTIELADGQRVGSVSITLWRHAAINGLVRDEYGDPVVAVQVRALLKTFRTGDSRWVAETIGATDDRGMYRLGSLTPGEYTVVVPSTNTVVDKGSTPRFAASASSVIVGDKILATGIPLSSGGERGLPYVYRTAFYPNAATSSQATSMMIGPGDEVTGVDFELVPVRSFSVSGTLTNITTSTRPSVEIMRAAEGPSGRIASISDIRVGLTTAEADGRFTFLGVPVGQYVIRTVNQGPEAPWAKEILVVSEGDVMNVVVPLRRGAVVSGRLEFEGALSRPTTERLLQTPISVEALDPRDGMSRIGRVTADGRFSTTGVPGGDYMIMVPGSLPGWNLKSVTVAGRDITDRAIEVAGDLSDVVLTFTDQVTQVRGHVSSAAGADAAASVLIFPGGGFPFTELSWANGSRRFQAVRVDKTGAYTFNVPPGDYFVSAVPEEMTANWIDAAFLAQLSASSTAIHLDNGEKRTLDLTTSQVRR